MSLRDTIAADMKAAMRSRDAETLDAIRLLRAAIQRREVDDQVTLDDEGIVTIVDKMIKQGKESIRQFEQGGRDDLVAKEKSTIDVIARYLPERLDEAALQQAVNDAISNSGASSMRDMGKVMAILKPALAGKADMGAVSALVKSRLQG